MVIEATVMDQSLHMIFRFSCEFVRAHFLSISA
jgi:hypothetical protein